MFSEAGQPLFVRVARGGGKGGGGGGAQPVAPPLPRVYTDPVNGMTFTDDSAGGFQNYGGGYYGMTPMTGTGKSGSQQLNEEIAARQAQEKATSDAAKQATIDTGNAAEQTFQQRKDSAYQSAVDAIGAQFLKQNLDPSKYWESDILPAVQRQYQSIKDLDPNPTAAFPTNLGSNILNDLTSGMRSTDLAQLNKTFTPTYAQTALPDSLIGNYANTLIGEQFDPLASQLLNASKRGTLQPAGYTAALDALNQKKSAALSTVTDLGKNLLAGDRSTLNDYISGARSDVNALNMSDTFDPNTYFTGAAGKVADYTSGFGGALRSAVGDTKYANLSDLINAGGAVQGAQNPNAANPAGSPATVGANYVPPDELAKQQRGLGNVGAF